MVSPSSSNVSDACGADTRAARVGEQLVATCAFHRCAVMSVGVTKLGGDQRRPKKEMRNGRVVHLGIAHNIAQIFLCVLQRIFAAVVARPPPPPPPDIHQCLPPSSAASRSTHKQCSPSFRFSHCHSPHAARPHRLQQLASPVHRPRMVLPTLYSSCNNPSSLVICAPLGWTKNTAHGFTDIS